MSLSSNELEEFKTRYQHAFNIRLSDEEALDLADRLEELYRIVLDRSAGAENVPRGPQPPWCSQLRSGKGESPVGEYLGPGAEGG